MGYFRKLSKAELSLVGTWASLNLNMVHLYPEYIVYLSTTNKSVLGYRLFSQLMALLAKRCSQWREHSHWGSPEMVRTEEIHQV